MGVNADELPVRHRLNGEAGVVPGPRHLAVRNPARGPAPLGDGRCAADMVGVRVRDEDARYVRAVTLLVECACKKLHVPTGEGAAVARIDERALSPGADNVSIRARAGEESRVETAHAHDAWREPLDIGKCHAVHGGRHGAVCSSGCLQQWRRRRRR